MGQVGGPHLLYIMDSISPSHTKEGKTLYCAAPSLSNSPSFEQQAHSFAVWGILPGARLLVTDIPVPYMDGAYFLHCWLFLNHHGDGCHGENWHCPKSQGGQDALHGCDFATHSQKRRRWWVLCGHRGARYWRTARRLEVAQSVMLPLLWPATFYFLYKIHLCPQNFHWTEF